MAKASVIVTSLLASILYLLLTLIYILPNNPLRIDLNNEVLLWNEIFTQRWQFFSPPPDRNYKCYFCYVDQTGGNKFSRYDVTSYLENHQRTFLPIRDFRQIPCRMVRSLMDDLLQEASDDTKYNEHILSKSPGDAAASPGGHDKAALLTFKHMFGENYEKGDVINPCVKVLAYYARIVAAEHGIDLKGKQLRIEFVEIPLPRIGERANLLSANHQEDGRKLLLSLVVNVDETRQNL